VLAFLLYLVLAGLVIGALGRLAIPGPNPMSIGMTILVGIGGSLVAGVIARLLFNRGAGLILAILCSAGIVWLLQRNERRRVP
jgi:uncharacterized membrane protein YeaQ/YmgE (transglycosylase-associated protein family)